MATPAQILDIGQADGQNHFNVGIGRPGAHTDYDCAQIAGGYSSDPEFISNAAGTAVQFRVRMDAARTSTNTKYPRSELREFNEAGTGNASWDGSSGTHYMQGVSKITHLQPVKPWVVFCQIHDASSDLVRVQTEGTSTTALKIVMRNTAPGSSTETVKTVMASYTLGTEIAWKLEVINGAGTLYLNGTSVGTFPAASSGCYFKAGAYAQSNSDTDAAAEYSAVELRSLSTWHTGYPTANPIVGAGGTGGGGTPAVTPASILDIGSVAGQNHWKYQGARTGNSAFFERSQQQIQDGYTEDPYFVLNTTKTAVQLKVNADAPNQSETAFPRAELRELGLDGTTELLFNALDGGVHYVRGRTRITQLGTSTPAGKDLIIAQLHDAAGPKVTIETQYVGTNVRLRCLINGSPMVPEFIDVAGDSTGAASIIGVEFAWMIKVEANVVKVYCNDMTTPAVTSSALVATSPAASWYFRCGAYPQFNEVTDAGAAAMVELRALEHWHTGWPATRGNGSASNAAPPTFGAAGAYVEHATGGPITPPFPAGTSPGHALLTQIYVRSGAQPPTPAGWAPLGTVVEPSPGVGRQSLYYRVYQANDVAPSYSGGTDGIYGRMIRIGDVDQITPFDATPVTATGASTTAPSAPSISVNDPSLVLWFIAQRNDYTHATPTNSATLAYTNTTTTGGDAVITAAYKTLAVPGTSAAMSVTASGATTLPEYTAIAVAASPVEPHVMFPVDAQDQVVEALDVSMFRSTPVPIIDLVVEATGYKKTVDQLDSAVEPLPVLMYAEPRTTPIIREVLTDGRLYTDSTDTVSVTTGTATQAGDTLVAIYGLDYGDANQAPGPVPGIWAQQAVASGGGVAPHIKVWSRRLDVGGAQQVSITHTDIYADAELILLVLAGCNEQQLVSMWAASSGKHATQHIAPAITPVDKDELLVTCYMSGPNAGDMGNYAAPTGMTKRGEVDATNYSTLAVATQALNARGSTGTRTAAFTRSTAPTTATGYASLTLGFRGASPTSSSVQSSPIGLTSELIVSKSVTATITSLLRPVNAITPAKVSPLAASSPLSVASAVGVERDVRTVPAGGPIDLSLWVLDDAGGYVGPLPDAISISLSPVINEPGGVQVTYPRDGHNFALLHDMITTDRDVEVAIWVGGREDGSLRAVLNESSGDEVDEHAVWTFSGTFLEARLGEAVVYPDTTNEKGEVQFTNATAGTVLRTLMAAAQARGTLTDLTFDSFTDVVGSNGARFTKVATMAIAPGQPYLAVLADLVEVGLCEWEVDGHALKLYEPETRGVDRTLQYPPITLRAGKDLTDSPRRHSVRESTTVLLAAGKDGIYQTASDPVAQTRRGRRIESYASQGNITDAGALLAYTEAALSGRAIGTMELSQGLAFAPGGPLPLADFDRFDWVLADNGNGLERLRVAQWTIVQDEHGHLTGAAVLNDLIADRQAKLAKQLAALQSGTMVVGTPAPAPTPTNEAKVPAAPTGLTASSVVYQQGSPAVSAAAVFAGWHPVTLNADGTPMTAGSVRYRLRYRYTDGSNPASPVPWPDGWVNTASDGFNWIAAGSGDGTSLQFSGVEPNKTIQIQVASVIPLDPSTQPDKFDDRGRAYRDTEFQSVWSPEFQLLTAEDSTAPLAPSTPLVTEYLGTVRISWDGTASDGLAMLDAAPDFSQVEIHLSTVANFEPDETTYRDRLFGAGATVITDLLYQVSYFAKLVAIDLTGNRSDPSEQGVAVPQPVVTDDVFDGAIGSAKLADLAVVRAKIADLAVNSAKIADLSVGKLTAGRMTADVLLAGTIRTASDGARIELDATSFRQFNSIGQLRTQFIASTGDALVTGTIRTGMSGKRIELQPDGTFRLFPDVGQNHNAIFNNGNEVVFRGQLDSNGNSGYLRVSAGGIAAQFGVPGTGVQAQLSVKPSNIDMTSPVNGLRVDKRFATADGTVYRNVLVFNDANGADIATSVIHHREWSSDITGLHFPGRNGMVGFDTGSGHTNRMVVTYNDGNACDLQCGNVYAPNVVAPSGRAVKQNITDVPFSPLAVVRGAKAKQWQYRSDTGPAAPPAEPHPVKLRRRKPGTDPLTGDPDDFEGVDLPLPVTPPEPPANRVGPIAEDIAAVAPDLVHTDGAGALGLSYMDLVGLLWHAVDQLADRVDSITDKFPDVDPLPGGAAKGANSGKGTNKAN